MHTIGYVRISRPESQDPASQIKLMLDRGIAYEDIFVDMTSGSISPLKRQSYKKMSDRLSQGDVTELVVSELSRIGRTVQESLMEVLKIQQMGIRIQSLSEMERMINDLPAGLQTTVISAMMYSAQLEREHIRERTRWGLVNAQQKGTKSGKPIGRPRVTIDFGAVKHLMADKCLKEAQALRVLGIKPRTYYTAKKTMMGADVKDLQPL